MKISVFFLSNYKNPAAKVLSFTAGKKLILIGFIS